MQLVKNCWVSFCCESQDQQIPKFDWELKETRPEQVV